MDLGSDKWPSVLRLNINSILWKFYWMRRWLNRDVLVAFYPVGWGFDNRDYDDCVREPPKSFFFFFFFTKTVSSLPLQAAEIEELSYVKKHCPRVFFIWFELYFREISYEKHCRLRVNFSISVRQSINIINSVDKPNFHAKTLSASRLKTMNLGKRHVAFCCSFKR